MKKFLVINYCESIDSVGGVIAQADTFKEAFASALSNAKWVKKANFIDSDIEASEANGTVTIDYNGCVHHWDISEVDIETDNLADLLALLVKHGFDFHYNPVTTAMHYKGLPLTAKVAIVDACGNERSSVMWCPELGVLVDLNDERITEMDAQEVCIWWLNKFRDTEVPYGEA